MTIEEHIKKAMINCPLTEEQEGQLLMGLENFLNEAESQNKSEHHEKYLFVTWINDKPIIDGSKYADTIQELMMYYESFPKMVGVEHTFCRIYKLSEREE